VKTERWLEIDRRAIERGRELVRGQVSAAHVIIGRGSFMTPLPDRQGTQSTASPQDLRPGDPARQCDYQAE
jgi:hypothetical protein